MGPGLGLPGIVIVGLPDLRCRNRASGAVGGEEFGLRLPAAALRVTWRRRRAQEGPLLRLPSRWASWCAWLRASPRRRTAGDRGVSLDGSVRHAARGAADGPRHGTRLLAHHLPAVDAAERFNSRFGVIPDHNWPSWRVTCPVRGDPTAPAGQRDFGAAWAQTDFARSGAGACQAALRRQPRRAQCAHGGSARGGKTLLARAIPAILPEMTLEESQEVTASIRWRIAAPRCRSSARGRSAPAPYHLKRRAGGRGQLPHQARSRWRTAGCSFWTSSPNSQACRVCASR